MPPTAHTPNPRSVAPHVAGRETLDEGGWGVLVDPQTSGGLLRSVDPEEVDAVLAHVQPRFPRTAIVGRVTAAGERALVLEN